MLDPTHLWREVTPLLIIWTLGIVLGFGTTTGLILSYKKDDQRLSLLVLAVVLGLGNIGIGFGAYPVAKDQTKIQAVGGFHQSLNGSLVEPKVEEIPCYQTKYGHSNCANRFSCDSYQVRIDDSYTDSKGKRHESSHNETRWQSCPVTTKEYTYSLLDNFGNSYPVAENIFDTDPKQYRSDGGDTHPIPAEVARGVPKRWQLAYNRIKADDAPGVAVDNVYENVIIGANVKSFMEQSDDVPELLRANLLPPHTLNQNVNYGIHDQFLADKMLFVGMDKPANYDVWQDRLMRGNPAIGMLAQGDLHIFAIRASALPGGISPDAYMSAVKAYLQSEKYFGKLALPKNTILLVLGVSDDGQTIKWARAKTGMPETVNGSMLNLLMLKFEGTKKAFDPDVVLGKIQAKIRYDEKKKKFVPDYGIDKEHPPTGIVPRVILVDEPFIRMCMLRCDDPKEKGMHSFVRLKDLIPISTKWTIISLIVQIALAVILMALMMLVYGKVTLTVPKFRQIPDDGNNRRRLRF